MKKTEATPFCPNGCRNKMTGFTIKQYRAYFLPALDMDMIFTPVGKSIDQSVKRREML
ncbi:hypothetical protein ZHAS_00014520 [Anopheles sinensis]|uniref:Uncharacterized protein n=1 Tax=Anopheles sinensis TaxID=74873 RepID=A0A084W8I3_ANOSI|nr:hypothetical protein ZHAS_00014520 [Anopheles sinensis]